MENNVLLVMLLLCLEFSRGTATGLEASYSGRACPGFHTFICEGNQVGNEGVSWSIFQPGEDFVYGTSVTLSSASQEFRVGSGFATATYISGGIGGNFSSGVRVLIDSSLQGARVSCREIGNFAAVRSITIEVATLPETPFNFSMINQQLSTSSVDLSIVWQLPAEPAISYSVMISPLAQLSSTEVTTSMVTVSAAQYNVEYTVTVRATNCIGSGDSGQFTFRIGQCPIPVAPTGGSLQPVSSRLVGSTVTFQCASGLGPFTATCFDNFMWGPDPVTFPCTTGRAGTILEGLTIEKLAISIVVTFIMSLVIGVTIGACAAYLIMKNRKKLAMDHITKNRQEQEYAQVHVDPIPWTNPAYSIQKDASQEVHVAVNSAYNIEKDNPEVHVAVNSAYNIENNERWDLGQNIAYSKARSEQNTWNIADNTAYKSVTQK